MTSAESGYAEQMRVRFERLASSMPLSVGTAFEARIGIFARMAFVIMSTGRRPLVKAMHFLRSTPEHTAQPTALSNALCRPKSSQTKGAASSKF